MQPSPNLANADLVDWFVEEGDGKIRIKVKEGAIVELQTVVMGVLRVGNDGNTGLPVYSVQAQQLVRLISAERKLRKSVLQPPLTDQGTPSLGVR
ncbi:MAG: hypothetical protein WBG19_06680 [Thermoplasmata archaeon]